MKIGYLGDFPFPGSTASTHRVRGIAQALALAGHDVTIVPLLKGDVARESDFEIDASMSRRPAAGSVSSATESLVGGTRAVSWLKDRRCDFDVVVMYQPPAVLMARYFWAARQGRDAMPPVVLDIVEWYDYSSRRGGRLGPFALEHAAAMNLIATRAKSVICISTYLARHFASHGCQTEVVPPLFKTLAAPREPVEFAPGLVHLGYSGSPGAKDGPGLANLFAATVNLPKTLMARLQIHIAGLNEAQGHALMHRYSSGFDTALSDTVRWHGRMSSEEAQRIVAACDFTYLQRPRARYAMAGFPTKVVESLILGTPAIVNATSDLAAYVADGQNGVWLDNGGVDGASRFAVSTALMRILAPGFRLALDRRQIGAQSSEAFHPERYADALDRLATAAATN